MAYTNVPWVNNIPLGGDNLNTADDQFRRLRLDINERQNDIVGDWTVDPVFVKTARTRRISWQSGSPGYQSKLWLGDPLGVHPLNISSDIFWVLPLPDDMDGATITAINMRVSRDAGAIIIAEAMSTSDAGAQASLGNAASAALGYHSFQILSGNFTVDYATKFYQINVSLSTNGALATSALLLGAIITYNLPYALRNQ